MRIYMTREWKGYGKQNYYWNEYHQEGDVINKYKCHRFKFFDGNENNWENEKTLENYWKIGDPDMPDWLERYIVK